MEVEFVRASQADVPDLIAVQDLAFREEFDRYGDRAAHSGRLSTEL